MLAATEPQVIRQLRVMGHRWRTQPYRASEIETNLVASAKLHTTTTAQGQGEVGEAESGRARMLAATEPQVIQQRRERVTNGGRSPVKTRGLRLIWLPVPQETTPPTATLTPLRWTPPTHTHTRTTPQRLPLQPRQRRTNTDTNNGGTNPCNNNRGQPRTAKDSPKKTPGAPRTLGDEPTHSLGGGGRADTSLSPTAGTRTKGN